MYFLQRYEFMVMICRFGLSWRSGLWGNEKGEGVGWLYFKIFAVNQHKFCGLKEMCYICTHFRNKSEI